LGVLAITQLVFGVVLADAACNQGLCAGSSCTISSDQTIDNGCVLAWAGKAVTITNTSELKTAEYGETFTIQAGSLNFDGQLEAKGGGITLDVSGSLSLDGKIDTSGLDNGDTGETDGGDVVVSAHDLTVTGLIDTHGDSTVDEDGDRGGGGGGDIELTSAGTLHLASGGILRATGDEGDGGDVALVAAASIVLAGNIATDSTCRPRNDRDYPADDDECATSGGGGAVSLEAGSAIGVTGGISATSMQGSGGIVDLASAANTNIGATASIVVDGSDSGAAAGEINLDAEGDIIVAGDLHANGIDSAGLQSLADAGAISIEVSGAHSVNITSTAILNAYGDDGDGDVVIEPACSVTIDGEIIAKHSSANDGTIAIAYREALAGGGSLAAGTDGITIDCRTNGSGGCASTPTNLNCTGSTCSSDELEVDPPADLSPVAFTSCTSVCGNAFVDAGEACDDGNAIQCDGCAPDCTIQGHGASCGTTTCFQGGTCSCSTSGCLTPGTCQNSQAVSCDDSNACTTDSACSVITGCTYAEVDCDDSNPSTRDWCNATLGCQHRSAAPLAVSDIIAIVSDVMDPCLSATPEACMLKAYACNSLAAVTRHKLSLGKLLSPVQSLSLRGQTTFSTPVDIDPLANGIRVIVADALTREPVLRATLPSGALSPTTRRGWSFNGSSTVPQWTYADKSGAPVGGITKVKLRLTASTGLVKIGITGKGHYQPANLSHALTAVLDFDPSALSTRFCSQLSFPTPGACRSKATGISCK